MLGSINVGIGNALGNCFFFDSSPSRVYSHWSECISDLFLYFHPSNYNNSQEARHVRTCVPINCVHSYKAILVIFGIQSERQSRGLPIFLWVKCGIRVPYTYLYVHDSFPIATTGIESVWVVSIFFNFSFKLERGEPLRKKQNLHECFFWKYRKRHHLFELPLKYIVSSFVYALYTHNLYVLEKTFDRS